MRVCLLIISEFITNRVKEIKKNYQLENGREIASLVRHRPIDGADHPSLDFHSPFPLLFECVYQLLHNLLLTE